LENHIDPEILSCDGSGESYYDNECGERTRKIGEKVNRENKE